MGLFHLIVCILIAPALSAGSALLQRGSSRQRTFAGLRFSPQDPAARTLLTLDTNKDGRIDPSEVAAFANAQGLDAAAATKEFSSIDVNGDGVLDSTELTQVLGPPTSTQLTATEVAPAATHLTATEAAPAAKAEAVKELSSAPAAKPTAPEAAEVLAEKPPVKLSAAAVTEVAAPPVAKATEVLAEADSPSESLISSESRTSLETAAQKVAEELGIEEQEERQARELERQAGEFRANSTDLIKRTNQDAMDAGVSAAHAKANELMAQISKLEDQAERAEVRASALRAKSKMEMEEGQQLMTAARQALAQDN